MRFFHFSEDCTTRYVSVIDEINPSELTYGSCPECGADNLVKWGNVTPVFEIETVTENRRLPDFMLYGGALVSFDSWTVVSENVKKLYEREHFSGCSFYPVILCCRKRGKYYELDRDYYIMSVTGRAKIDFKAMNTDCSVCGVCGHYIFEGTLCPLFTKKGVYPTVIDENSWDGSDVFNQNDCTERFVKKVLEAGLTGIDFICFEQKYDAFERTEFFKTLNGFNKILHRR